jgi:DNA polymerase-3 subunit gamma/tau
MTFAETRKMQQADYHLLNQPFERQGVKIIVPLANPIQETLLSEFKTELNTFLREKLQNNTIQVTGELRLPDDKKIIYTNRDKFTFLTSKNPLIQELKDRLGLDPDF